MGHHLHVHLKERKQVRTLTLLGCVERNIMCTYNQTATQVSNHLLVELAFIEAIAFLFFSMHFC